LPDKRSVCHAKNFSLLHDESGAIRFAPLYDMMSTLFYGDDKLAMYIDKVHRTNRVTLDGLLNEAASWGLTRSRSTELVNDIMNALPGAIQRATEETPGLPLEIPEIVTAQLDVLRGHTWMRIG
jgi:serine/threonine-protein kinase HipA